MERPIKTKKYRSEKFFKVDQISWIPVLIMFSAKSAIPRMREATKIMILFLIEAEILVFGRISTIGFNLGPIAAKAFEDLRIKRPAQYHKPLVLRHEEPGSLEQGSIKFAPH